MHRFGTRRPIPLARTLVPTLTLAFLLALAGAVLSVPSEAVEPEDPASEETEPAEPTGGESVPAAPTLPGPYLRFEGDSVVATGLAPSSEILLFGVARRPLGYHQRIERFEELLTTDAAGEARFDLEEGLPSLAVWAAVDTASGEIATAPSPGFPGAARPFPSAGLHGGGGGVPARLVEALEAAHVLYVRPGEGAWGIALAEGGAYDADGTDDGILELAFEQMVPVGPSSFAAPAESLPGDVLVVVDPGDLAMFTLRVTPDVLHR